MAYTGEGCLSAKEIFAFVNPDRLPESEQPPAREFIAMRQHVKDCDLCSLLVTDFQIREKSDTPG